MEEHAPSTERPPVRPRNIDFGLSPDLPRQWHGGNPWTTHFFNGLSLMFPEGERFFMDSVRHFQEDVTDPRLREDIRGFLGQEGMHGREHRKYNEMLEAQGYPARRLERHVRTLVKLDRKHPWKGQLAMTCALEHFTAIMADVLLRHPEIMADAHPAMARLWRWHALEEAEHKSVAFDVYRAVAPGFGGYLRRIVYMMMMTVFFGLQILIHQIVLVYRDRRLLDGKAFRESFRFFWRRPGFLRLGMRHYRHYYRRDFHPWQHDNSDLIERGKAEFAYS